jgi:hypothetical protein
MDKKIIILGMLFGSIIGGYIPTIFGANVFSMTSVISGAIGGLLGIWLSFKLLN